MAKSIPYCYSPLPPGNGSIRLLRLKPNKDKMANIQCELFEYSLQNSCEGIHLYDALSYVWGNPDKTLPIFLHKHRFDVTINLHTALLRLRNHSMERTLWVDAICINQTKKEEKEDQIQFMAKIYGQANRVLVWVGDAADDSDLALEAIRVAGGKKSTNSSIDKTLQQAVLALLERPWFRRIWILQEVAAARHVLLMCGLTQIDGYAFCLGVDSLKELYEARADLRSLIRSVTYLIRGAIFRPNYVISRSSRSSLNISPLGELMDMYHTQEATKRHDKVYALLGMSSDDLSKVNLSPNYDVPWEELLQRVTKYLLSEKISVETLGDKEVAVIKSKGCIIGKVSSVQSDMAWDGRQGVDVIFKNIPEKQDWKGKWSAHWIQQPSAKPIQEGDLICLLQGASKPTIIRLCNDYFIIVMIAATPSEDIQTRNGRIKWSTLSLSKVSPSEQFFTRDFLLVWDWEDSSEKLQYQFQERYKILTERNNGLLEHSKTELESHIDKATRTWNVALILGDSEEYQKAEEQLYEAVKGYEMAFGKDDSYTLGSEYGLTPLVWAAGHGYNTVVSLLFAKYSIDADLKDKKYGRTPLSWAAEGGHEAVVKQLLETGKINVDSKDSEYGRTPLSWAAEEGHEAVVKLLLETGKADVDSKNNRYGQTPLSLAAEQGHEAVVRLLLEIDKIDVDSKDSEYGRTPLSWAAEEGHEAVVKLLLETGKIDVDSMDPTRRTPLLWAAGGGHEAVVKLLLETGKINVNSKDMNGRTPLWLAAKGGHEAVVKLLIETGKVDVELKDRYGRTPLWLSAKGGHEAMVELLVKIRKVDVNLKDSKYKQTPLWLAVKGGHEAIVKLLLETGKVNCNSKDYHYKQTPLSWAASGGHAAVVKLLLKMGKVEVDLKDRYGRTPLCLAAKGGHEAVVKLLLDTDKIDINSKDSKYEQTPLWLAVKRGHEAVVKLLLETGKADVNLKDNYSQQTPLSLAAEQGHEAVVRLLLETGKADTDSMDIMRRTPLSWAAEGGHEAVVRLLLETGKADVDSKDSKYGQTPLSLAAEQGHEAVVRLLLETGKADVNSKDNYFQQTPLSLAAEQGNEAVVRLLLETDKIDIDSKDSEYGRTPLSWAAVEGHEAVVKLLLETGKVDVDSMDIMRRTPLSWAAGGRHEAVVKLLESHNSLS